MLAPGSYAGLTSGRLSGGRGQPVDLGENGHGSLAVLLGGRGYEARIETDLEVAPPSVRIPGSVAAAPVCWNGWCRRCWKLPNTKNRGERQGTPAVNPWQVALLPPAAWTSMKIIPGNRRLSFTRRRASPTGATHDCPVAGYPAADDIGFPSWGISPTRRAVGGAPALPKGAPPTLNYLPGVPAPTAALKFVKTISGTRCSGLGSQPRTCAGPGGDGPSSLAVRCPVPLLGWVGWRKSEAGGRCV